jgi:hypothetical protein
MSAFASVVSAEARWEWVQPAPAKQASAVAAASCQ